MSLRQVSIALPLLIGSLAALSGQSTGPRAWAGAMELPTWDEGPPDPLPPLGILGAEKPWYPYALRTTFSKQRRVQQWRTLNLENEYLRCVVLPDLGGRMYRCQDKLSGYEMFHANGSIKKANIALRGAWAAAGMELNFPESHSLLTVSPVDFRTTQTADSASVWVGATDRVTGMRWRVEFRLARGSAVLEQNVRIENAGGAPRQYSWWSNAGVTLRDDTRFLLPARQVATHGRTRVDHWPVGADGIDRSVPANYPTSLGLFASGPAEPWFAVYQGRARTGTLHFAGPDVPGKKIWVWGKAEDQEIRAMLSDDGSQYVEMQAGLFENQETFGELAPGQARSFTEYWMPVRGLSGVTQAARDAVLWLAREGGALKLELQATRALKGAVVRVGGASETVTLDPAKVWSKTIAAPPAGPAQVELRDAAGKVLLAYTEGEVPGAPDEKAARMESQTGRGLVKQAALARAAGDGAGAAAAVARAAALDPTDSVARFEQVRQGAADSALWTHLAADAERILEVADCYLQWGMPREADIVIGYRYAPVPSNWMEQGMPLPEDYALLAYYRGYVHQRLDRYATEDFRMASTLPLAYVFPNRASSRAVLEAALAANPGDASAHYLLGLWDLNAGNREAGGREVQAANRLRPEMPEARVLLALMKLPAVVQAPKGDKAPAVKPPPAPARAPQPVSPPVATQPAPAPSVPPAEVSKLLDLAAAGGCAQASALMAEVAAEGGARAQYWVAVAEAKCVNRKAAARRWEQVAKMKPGVDSPDYVYPQLALAALGRGFDAVSPYMNLRRALEGAQSPRRAVLLYNEALLLLLQGRRDQAPVAGLPPELEQDLARLRAAR